MQLKRIHTQHETHVITLCTSSTTIQHANREHCEYHATHTRKIRNPKQRRKGMRQNEHVEKYEQFAGTLQAMIHRAISWASQAQVTNLQSVNIMTNYWEHSYNSQETHENNRSLCRPFKGLPVPSYGKPTISLWLRYCLEVKDATQILISESIRMFFWSLPPIRPWKAQGVLLKGRQRDEGPDVDFAH